MQRQLERLASLSPGADVLGLERIGALCARLGHPERRLPPLFHVAGTNGKGSTCAFLRAALEAAGLAVHVYTSPHLVRFNERIRLAGTLIEDEQLAGLLDEVLSVADGIGPSFFEVTTAAALLAFSRVAADACVIEVGLGGRLDATNIVPHPLVCGIAQLGLDHQSFLGTKIEQIAAEKAGIAKRGVPLVTLAYPPPQAERVAKAADAAGARWLPKGTAWRFAPTPDQLRYEDGRETLSLPLPTLPGAHQSENAALAVAMLRHQERFAIPREAMRIAMHTASWPARLQRIDHGALAALLPPGSDLWLDGGHNPAAAAAIAPFMRAQAAPAMGFHLILGMLANKDLGGFLEPFADSCACLHAVPIPGHEHHDPAAILAAADRLGLAGTVDADVTQALVHIAESKDPATVLIGGSLYLAGLALSANGTPPT